MAKGRTTTNINASQLGTNSLGNKIASSSRKPFDPNDPKDIKKEILPDGTVRWVEKKVHPTRT